MKTNILKKSLFIILFSSLFVGVIYAKPWTDTSRFKFSFSSSESHAWDNVVPAVNEIYIKRFGAFPNILLREDAYEPRVIRWGVFYTISRKDYEKEKPWNKPVFWKDLKEYVFLKIRNIQTQEIDYYPVTMGNDNDTLDYDSYYGTGWGAWVKADAWDLPLKEGITYAVCPEIWDGDPEKGNLIASASESVYVARTKKSEPIDYYQEAYFEDKLKGDPDLCVELLDSFPFNYTLLSHLIYRYKNTQNCDSLKWATSQMIYALENRLDDFYLDKRIVGRPERTNERLTFLPGEREKYMEYVQNVCGDTLLPPPWRTK